MEYIYGGFNPYAVTKAGDESYTYDSNGNPTLIEGDTTYREMVWNEENRMMLLSDKDYVSRYTYDYNGTCVIKSHGPMQSIYINGTLQGVDFHDDENYTLYVSPYMTVNADRFTKYYYAGTQRVASKIGSGEFDNVYGVNGFHLTAGQKDYAERAVEMVDGVKEYYKEAGITPGVPNQLGENADPYVSGVAYPNKALGNYDVPSGWPGNVHKNEQGDVPGPPVWFDEDELQSAEAGAGFDPDNQRENDMFFFHTDHLGSTSYLTDTAGNVSQFVWYAPYGEALIDEHTTGCDNWFKFSGKELDDITGLYDHGARSRNPISTLWYGIDPLFEKYPDFSPYNYCAGNPVKLVDPDGRGFNGGFAVYNNSNCNITVIGDGQKGGADVTGGRFTLGPKQVLIPYCVTENGKECYYAKIEEIDSHKVIEGNDKLPCYDVDAIEMSNNLTIYYDGDKYNLNPCDKEAETPHSPIDYRSSTKSSIKIRAGLIPGLKGEINEYGGI